MVGRGRGEEEAHLGPDVASARHNAAPACKRELNLPPPAPARLLPVPHPALQILQPATEGTQLQASQVQGGTPGWDPSRGGQVSQVQGGTPGGVPRGEGASRGGGQVGRMRAWGGMGGRGAQDIGVYRGQDIRGV